jgi:hypothetical protein
MEGGARRRSGATNCGWRCKCGKDTGMWKNGLMVEKRLGKARMWSHEWENRL